MGLFQPKHTPPLKHEVDEYITRMIKEWKDCEHWEEDEKYWFFWQDFGVFTEDIFRLASRTALRDLWEYLITQKVWVNKPTSGAPYATVLQKALQRHSKDDDKTPHKWTENEEQERRKVFAIQQAREQAPFKVQDLPEDPTSILNPPKAPTIEPGLPISPAVAIPTSAPIPTTFIVSGPAKPQVQPQPPLTLCRNCQAAFTSRNRLHKHLQFNCSVTSTTSSSPSLQSFDYVQQQIIRHLDDLRLRSHPIYPPNQQSRNTLPPVYQPNPHSIRPTTTLPSIHQTSRKQTKQRTLIRPIQPTMRWNRGSQAKAQKGTRILRLLLRLLM